MKRGTAAGSKKGSICAAVSSGREKEGDKEPRRVMHAGRAQQIKPKLLVSLQSCILARLEELPAATERAGHYYKKK